MRLLKKALVNCIWSWKWLPLVFQPQEKAVVGLSRRVDLPDLHLMGFVLRQEVGSRQLACVGRLQAGHRRWCRWGGGQSGITHAAWQLPLAGNGPGAVPGSES